MSLQTYWLADPNGSLIRVEGAAERDRLAGLGWVVAEEPKPADKVWIFNPTTGGWAAYAYETLPVWEARDWQLAVPPLAEGDLGHYVDLPAPAPQPAAVLAPDPPAEPPAPETTEAEPEAKPMTESKKERNRA